MVFRNTGFVWSASSENVHCCLLIRGLKSQKRNLLLLLALGLLGLLGGGTFLGGLLLGEKDSVDVGEDTAGSDGNTAEELVELFVVADSELNVTGSDAGALVVAGGVTGELEDFSGEVFHHRGEVHGGTTADAGSIAALAKEAGHTADRELKTSARAARLALASRLAFTTTTFAFSGHSFKILSGHKFTLWYIYLLN